MNTDCISIYDLLDSQPAVVALTSATVILALPICAGLSLFAKHRRDKPSRTGTIGQIGALIWAVGLLLRWLAPETFKTLLSGPQGTLIFLLAYCATLLAWAIAAIKSRLRPLPHDLIVIALIALLPILAIAKPHQPKTICSPTGFSQPTIVPESH